MAERKVDCVSSYCRTVKVLDISVVGVYTLLFGATVAIITAHVSKAIEKRVDPDLKDPSQPDSEDLPTHRRTAALVVLMVDMALVLLGCYAVRMVLRKLPRPGTSTAAHNAGYDQMRLKELAGAAVLAITYGSLMSPALASRFKRAFGWALPKP